ncbi:helix-turn-helix domain-containing protein [Streptomyces sp. DH10]|uniref:helix-turn-helix domain-containing protein n=1 Tax=Streptomyces sp. DH10 TaxID=3040121 RepID=UPI002441E2CA|nr:helix-turn-helix domain-containing protein [Streptomyces sp. DH10]MDG9711144.1 helix-turn-helix domain-containing protein [Streptomyces sp. DH10]
MPNAILRNKKLSLTARGLLGHLLSLPDGAKMTVEKICAEVEEGRERVRKAMAQLETAGYVRRVRRQLEGGLWSTVLHVSDVPMVELPAELPNDRFPTVGEPKTRAVGASPVGGKTLEKELPPTPVAEKAAKRSSEQQGGEGDSSQQEKRQSEQLDRALSLLRRLGLSEARLEVSAAHAMEIAPLVVEWFSRGLTDLEVRNALAAGLPEQVKSPRALLRHRLVAMLPEQRYAAPGAPSAAPAALRRAECVECGRWLPKGAPAGFCRDCKHLEPVAPATVAPTAAIDPRAGREKVRAALAGASS